MSLREPLSGDRRARRVGLVVAAILSLCDACGGKTDDVQPPMDGSIGAEGSNDEGGLDGASSHADGPAEGGSSGEAGPTDGGQVQGDAGEGGAQDAGAEGAPPNDAGMDAPDDVGCTTPTGAAYQCGPTSCNGATSYCQQTIGGDMCMSMPAACECVETRDCTCLLANVPNPCGVGATACTPREDGGLLWFMALDCP